MCAVDEDNDGYGLACPKGDDCNDHDPTLHAGCEACSQPEEGCECAENTAPVDCYEQSLIDADTLLCHSGKRYCRDGEWTACQGVTTFEAPVRRDLSDAIKSILGTPGTMACSPCSPACYPVTDLLDPVDGGLTTSNSSEIAPAPGGGITITSSGTTQLITPTTSCIPGTCSNPDLSKCDSDCDGIPDLYDIAVANKPFGTTISSVFLQVAPGETENAVIDLNFYLRTADVYFLLDTTDTMQPELTQLVTDMTTGNFLQDTRACADTDRDGVPNDELKTRGIAGNIACRARNVYLGTGWSREIPFGASASATTGLRYGDSNEFLYEQRVDMQADATAVQKVIADLRTDFNYVGPNGQMLALHMAATGKESYVGWNKPALPKRYACGLATWGYPCFRDDAFPIIVMITDEPLYNGPTKDATGAQMANLGTVNQGAGLMSVPFNYPSDILTGTVSAGTADPVTGAAQYYSASPNKNENLTTAFDVGTINGRLVTYTGNTRGMTADIDGTILSCMGTVSATGPDAVYYFTVDTAKELIVSTKGTRFTSVAGVFLEEYVLGSGGATTFTTSVDTSTGAGDTQPAEISSAPLPSGVDATVTGKMVTTAGELPREVAGVECYDGSSDSNPSSTKSTDYAQDLLFHFNLSKNMDVRFWVDSVNKMSLSLFDSFPNTPVTVKLASTVGQVTVPTGSMPNGDRGPTINDQAYRYILDGDPDGDMVPDDPLNTTTMPASVAGAPFISKGCGEVEGGTARGFKINFNVTKTTDVAIDTNGDGVGLDVTSGSNAQAFHAIGGTVGRAAYTAASLTGILDGVCEDETSANANASCQITQAQVADKWIQFTGAMDAFTPEVPGAWQGAGSCHLGGSGSEVVQRLVLTNTRTLKFDTTGSLIDTYLSVHGPSMDPVDETVSVGVDPYTLGASSIIDDRTVIFSGTTANGDMTVPLSDSGFQADGITRCMFGDSGLDVARDVDHVFTTTKAQTVTITLPRNFNTGFDGAFALYKGTIGLANLVTGLNGASCGFERQTVIYKLDASSTYHLVVLNGGPNKASTGSYAITVDAGGKVLDCAHNSVTGKSSLERTLTAGTYYVVVKAKAVTDIGNFVLNIQDRTAPASVTSLLACAQCSNQAQQGCIVGNDGGTKVAARLILKDLAPGSYSVMVRPTKTARDLKTRVMIRDLNHLPLVVKQGNGEEACHNTRGGNNPESFTATNLMAKDVNGVPIDYYLLLRGFNPSDVGAFSLHIQDVNPAAAGTSSWCAGSAADENGEIRRVFNPGKYYAVIKGLNANDVVRADGSVDPADKGWYQITFGDPTLATTANYTPVSWYGPDAMGGVGSARAAVVDRNIHVIGINTGTNTVLTNQLSVIASDTQATHPNGKPLVVQTNGATAVGAATVQMVEQLSFSMQMDVNIVLVKAPDNPNGTADDFRFYVEAIDAPDDGCDGVEDRQVELGWPATVQRTPDTHTNCVAGALPPFRVYFHNPMDFPVPCNGFDANGACLGYSMRLDLIGNEQYVIEQVPVYIIPRNVGAEPITLVYKPVGSYWQDFSATNCTGSEVPDWGLLSWDAKIPANGAKVHWDVCTKSELSALASCTYTRIATVTSDGVSCTANSACPNGFCQNGSCQYPVGPACTSSAQCSNGTCGPAGRCVWTSPAIDLGPFLPPGDNGLRNMRVRVGLEATSQLNDAPIVYEWTARYRCETRE